jgi:hypothetical protein
MQMLPYKTYGVRKSGNLGQITIRLVPKQKGKMKTFLSALSSVLYIMVSVPPREYRILFQN